MRGVYEGRGAFRARLRDGRDARGRVWMQRLMAGRMVVGGQARVRSGLRMQYDGGSGTRGKVDSAGRIGSRASAMGWLSHFMGAVWAGALTGFCTGLESRLLGAGVGEDGRGGLRDEVRLGGFGMGKSKGGLERLFT